MQSIIIKPENFYNFVGVTPWYSFWFPNIPVEEISEPKNYLFTTCSGTTPVLLNNFNEEHVGGIANFRYDFEKGKPVIKRYEKSIVLRNGKFICTDVTDTLKPYEHHIYGISTFVPAILESVPYDWRVLLNDFYNNPIDWR